MMSIQLLLVLSFLLANNASGLKGLKRNGSVRLLQEGPPVAGAPKESTPTEPKVVEPKVAEPSKDPKAGEPKGDAVSKEKKVKKCKKAKMTPPLPPSNEPEVRQLQTDTEGEPMMMPQPAMEEEFCLKGDATEAECQAAMTGKLPAGHQRIKADVEIDVSYKPMPSSNDLVKQVEQIFNSETAAEFIGCDSKNRRLAEEATGMDNSTSAEEVRVTGVGFKNLKTIGEGNCTSTNADHTCDTISSNVEIHYTGTPVTASDQEEMFAVLIATIKAQAADGDFSEIGTIENVEVSSEISSANGNGSNVAQTAGIPAGVVGAFLVVLGGVVIGYCMMKKDRHEDHQESNDVPTAQRGANDVVEAEAIVVVDDEEKKDSKWKFNPSKFL